MNSQWGVIFFIHEANTLPSGIKIILSELRQLPFLAQTRVAVIVAETKDGKHHTQLFEFQYSPGVSASSLFLKEDFREIDMRKKESWVTVLGHARKTADSNKYILITWGHGSRLGILKEPGSRDKENRLAQVPLKTEESSTPGILWASELADAIHEVFGPNGLDALLMINCAMQTFETGFDLHESVSLLIAPETNIFMTDFPYAAIIQKLENEPSISKKCFADFCINAYKHTHELSGIQALDKIACIALSAVDLKLYPRLFRALESIAILLLELMKNENVELKLIRKEIGSIKPHFTDMGYMLDTFIKNISDPVIAEQCSALKDLLINDAVIAKYTGLALNRTGMYVNGISICFPKVDLHKDGFETEAQYYLSVPSQNRFAKQSSWVALMKYYMKTMEPVSNGPDQALAR